MLKFHHHLRLFQKPDCLPSPNHIKHFLRSPSANNLSARNQIQSTRLLSIDLGLYLRPLEISNETHDSNWVPFYYL